MWMVHPVGERGGASIWWTWCGVAGRDLSCPLLIRFDDILEDRWSGFQRRL